MYDLSVTHVDCDMSTIADQVSWLSICIRNFCSPVLLLIRCSRKAVAKLSIYTLCKSRAVSSTCKTCATPYIWVSNKLCSIIYD